MRYCFHCGRITPGKPLFCNFCGRSYDTKFCPRLHPNSREAQACSQCGSRILTIPQPKLSWHIRPLLYLLGLIPGVLLLLLTCLYFIALVYVVFAYPTLQFRFMLLGLVVALLWLGYMELPVFIRRDVQRPSKRPKDV